MSISKCPLCGSPCILKIIATENETWCKVDVCELCQTMYPRGRSEVKVTSVKKAKTRKTKKTKSKPKKKTKRR